MRIFSSPLLHRSTTVKVSVTLLSSQREALLLVLRVNIYGQNGFQKQGKVLLDSGAQVSSVCEETAAMLGLKGKDMSVTITKVGGEEETIETKVYKVPVSSPDRA